MNKFFFISLSIPLYLFSLSIGLGAVSNTDDLSALKPRAIGPANMSGRLSAIAVSPENHNIIYVGSATGGLWKSLNGGITWTPIFDKENTSSIGDVAIDPQNPNIVWVGTGEANPRNSVGVGRGVYKSLDGGMNWTCLGLEATEKISRIQINPLDPNIVYVGALGTTWNKSEDRGVYKTIDGGKSWRKVKYVSDLSGVADLAMNPENPNHLLAAFWEHQRWPWFFKSGGKGSGLHVSWDGGENWQQLGQDQGIPGGELGRIGLAFATNMPQVVYALVESEKNVLLRSSDSGKNWQLVNQDGSVGGRPFYYCDIRVNPVNENIVYSLESSILVSEDGGRSFRSMANWTQSHPDYHAMWISPDGKKLIIGNDGGLVISSDRGENFHFVSNLPVAQFYHVSYDMEFPYNVYGGLQDNGSWKGPSTVLTDRAIYPSFWTMVGFGDGFDVEPDPEDPACGYAMSQGGALFYYNTRTAHRLDIRPSPGDVTHRYNWNAALALDPFKPGTIYYGSQFVHRSPDKGMSWEIISPDLTTNDPRKQHQDKSGGLTPDVTAAENHTTILNIAPSPLKEGLIWVATDDGQIQLTRDHGKTWRLVSAGLTGLLQEEAPAPTAQAIAPSDSSASQSFGSDDEFLPTQMTETIRSDSPTFPSAIDRKRSRKTPVPHGSTATYVEPSNFDPGTAYVVFDDHQRSNWTPYVFVTRDYGKSWRSLATRDIDGFCHVIKEDRKNPQLLFLGTEFGLFYSHTGGKKWTKWTSGFPTVPVREMQIHPREDDLIIGTHGRAIYILDHLASLRELKPELLKQTAHLFSINPAYLYQPGWGGAFVSPGDGTFSGENRPTGSIIDYIFNPGKKEGKSIDTAKIEICDAQGTILRTMTQKSKPGLNRLIWNMRSKGIEGPRPASRRQGDAPGPLVLPGIYTVKLTVADQTVTQRLEIKPDPRLPFDHKTAEANHTLSREASQKAEEGFTLYKKLNKHLETINTIRPLIVRQVSRDETAKNVLQQLSQVEKKIRDLLERMIPTTRGKGISSRPDSLSSALYRAINAHSDRFDLIPQNAKVLMERAMMQLSAWQTDARQILDVDILALEKTIMVNKIPLFSDLVAPKTKH